MKSTYLIYRQALLGCLLGAAILGMVPASAQNPVSGLPSEVRVNGVEFVLVPEGWFYKTGGVRSENREGGGNAKVWLDTYYIAKYEARARDLMPYLNTLPKPVSDYGGDETSCSVRLGKDGHYMLVSPADDLPATHLSWQLADRWARFMGFRLPSEAEWEKAARGTDQRLYPWGNQAPDETYANFDVTSDCLVWPVDRYIKGQSPHGVFNMAGNVREYIADWHNPQADAAWIDGLRNPPLAEKPASEPRKMLKGGRWASKPRQMRIDARVMEMAERPFQCNGTRFAIDASAVKLHLDAGKAQILKP
jgi:formylglycine-generating enzyme required for sulfatase activity